MDLILDTLGRYYRVAPDTELAGYPANLFCRISGIRYPAGYPAK